MDKMPYDIKLIVDEVSGIYKQGYEQGRADAIDEMFDKVKEHCKFECQSTECYQLECPFCDDHCWINRIADLLKEQNDKPNEWF